MSRAWLERYGVALAVLAVLGAFGAAGLVWWVPIAARYHANRLASSDELTRLAAESALVELGPRAIPTLGRFADHPDRRVRLGVAHVLADLATEGALERLVPMVRDRDAEVRQCAAWTLLRQTETLRRAGAALRTDDPDPVVRLCAVQVLPGHNLAAAVERLLPALEDGENLVRLAAIRRLRALTGREFGFDAFADRAARAAAVARWQAWWQAERQRLPKDRAHFHTEPSLLG